MAGNTINRIIAAVILSIGAITSSGCTATDVSIITTKLPAEYKKDNVYFYRTCSSNSAYNSEFALIEHDIKTGEEKEMLRTISVVGVRLYDDDIYYFNSKNDLCSLNLKTLKSEKVYEGMQMVSLPKNDYVIIGSKLIYLDSSILHIKNGERENTIETVWDFNVCENQIYYVDVNREVRHDWSIKKLVNEKTLETETLLRLGDIKAAFEDAFREDGQINNISICNNKLYFTVGEYPIASRYRLYYIDLDSRELHRFSEEYIYEYQSVEGAVYCRGEDNALRKYTAEGTEIIKENVYSFKVKDDVLMYMKKGSGTLYVEAEGRTAEIEDVLFG